MAETVWYYARGEVERGPFTSVQIKALANAGKLRADDLVWKEGMENWTSAAEVAELFSDRPADSKISSPAVAPAAATSLSYHLERASRASTEFEKLVTTVCRGSVFVGLLCILLVQGCESLGERRIARLQSVELQSTPPGTSVDNVIARSPEVRQAQAELTAGSFGRGIILYGGLLFLLIGAAGLATFATAIDRWLGVAVVSIVCFCLLSAVLTDS